MTREEINAAYETTKVEFIKTQAAVEKATQTVKDASKIERDAITAAAKANPQVAVAHAQVNEASKELRAAQAASSLAAKIFADAAAKRDAASKK